MKKFAIPAIVGALALAACDQSETTVEADDGTSPVATETQVVTETVEVPGDGNEGSSVTIDGGDVDATIGEDGVQAEIDLN